MATAIEFNNVGKMYRLGLVGTGTLSDDLNRWWTMNVLRKEDPYLKIGQTNDRTTKGDSDYVWALRDISFKVEQGDVVGIIGKNGAGKSTLLKLLSHITAPTTGSIRYNGRIASLLEVGTGFHPEMTGRENIYMNGSIMGMTKAEITRKLDEIVDFAGVERYLDTPTKRYSSGMKVRLGFAVAAFLEPEILVVDEVLTVGDAEFQKKAIGKMNDVAHGEGRTVLFVSHNMASVKALCNTGVLIENGMLKTTGSIEDVITEYISGYDTIARLKSWDIEPNKPVSFLGIHVYVEGKTDDQLMDMSDEIHVRIRYYVNEDIANTNIGFTLLKNGIVVFKSWDCDKNPAINICRKKGYHETDLVLPSILLAGVYDITLGVGQPNIGALQLKESCLQFEISNVLTDGTRKSFSRGGIVKADIQWTDKIIE